jgi:hypothetical protein
MLCAFAGALVAYILIEAPLRNLIAGNSEIKSEIDSKLQQSN